MENDQNIATWNRPLATTRSKLLFIESCYIYS